MDQDRVTHTYLINKEEKGGIYKIEHLSTGRVYVGSSVDLARRRREHINRLTRGTHVNPKLQNAWKKYGADQFSFSVLERCQRDMLLEREQWHIEDSRAALDGFNVMPTAGTTMGFRHSPETIAKIKLSNTGKRHDDLSISKMRGRIVTDATRALLSAVHLGRKLPVEVRESMSRAQKARDPFSAETRARISAAKTGTKRPPVTEETREKLREGQKRRRASEKNTGSAA